MSNAYRTASGGRIARGRPVSFRFDGLTYQGFHGDTLASALLANGVHLVARSFKYHRPRGILAAGSEEPNALVTVRRDTARVTPNLRATQVELYEGLEADSQNRWPSLKNDVGAINDRLSRLFPAGFYYKTFMGPLSMGANKAWATVYEPLIRRAAGLGRAPELPDPDRYASRYAHCDVLVIGAGAAGLAAATAAADAGARVMVCDEQSAFGGALLSETQATIDGKAAEAWVAESVAALGQNARVRLLPRTTAFGYFHDNVVALAERVTDHLAQPSADQPRERLWQVFAKEVVITTGAIERPLVFPDNDRPGIMLADAARTYLERYGVACGRRAVIVGSHDTIYATALALRRNGVGVAAVLDTRAASVGAQAVQAAGIKVTFDATVVGTMGRTRVSAVETATVSSEGRVIKGERISCDHVLMCGGWTPAVHLFSQSRGKLRFDEVTQAFLPGNSQARERSAGACAGVFGLATVIESGFAAGSDAAGKAGYASGSLRRAAVAKASVLTGIAVSELPHSRDASAVKAFVDFQNDVTAKDIRLAVQEGFRSIEHVKRYTTTGMATDQGKTSNMAALGIAATALAKPIPAVGLTTFRMPYTPVTFGTIAGHSRGGLFDPVRRTPIDPWAQSQGAVFEDVGLWKRARYFPRHGEAMHAAVNRECVTVRSTAGLFDASTLGKIEVVGSDAAQFLERMYINSWAGLAVGRCRYCVMLNEAGFVIDDGVIGRIAADRFHVTTTTGGAARVLHMMEDYLQTEWPELRVSLTSTTEQWAVIAVQGPKAREIIAPFVSAIDLAPDAFPHMAVRAGTVCGVEARVFRVSFSGELGFEINVPADYGRGVWETLWRAAQARGACAYGTEAMHVLRAEKGFIIVGQETDGTVTPHDLGMTPMISKVKRDFVGKRSLVRPDMLKADRKQLVGLATRDAAVVLEEGAQIVATARAPTGTSALGHVTSSYWSAALGRSIALALVAGGRARLGTTLYVPMPEADVVVEVVAPVFVDAEGGRVHA